MKHERIEIDPKIMGGKPTIKGTRIPVEMILDELGAKWTAEQILKEHPTLSREDIYAVQAFAADHIREEEILFG